MAATTQQINDLVTNKLRQANLVIQTSTGQEEVVTVPGQLIGKHFQYVFEHESPVRVPYAIYGTVTAVSFEGVQCLFMLEVSSRDIMYRKVAGIALYLSPVLVFEDKSTARGSLTFIQPTP